jgi:lysozyme
MLTIGARGLDLIKSYELCVLHCYDDARPTDPVPAGGSCAGMLTIGWGHTMSAQPGMVITQAEADQLLLQDLTWVEAAVHGYVTVPLTPAMFDALCSFVFNVGETNFAGSTLLRVLNDADYHGAVEQWVRWYKTPGFELGLQRRRLAEATLFLEDGL